MKVVVAGSRDIEDRDEVRFAIEDGDLVFGPVDEIVHGGARGVDSIAADIADARGFDVCEFEADWDEYGAGAGPIRNQRMAEYADALIAVWDGKSDGTRSMIEKALEEPIPVYVHIVE